MKTANDPRHEARKIALQALFEWSYNSIPIEEIMARDIDLFIESLDLEDGKKRIKPNIELALFIVKGVTDNLDELDRIIEKSAPEWPVNQIAKTDLEVLRLAIFELYIARNVPPKVAIDEAVELAKEFGGENSSKFINGVLGTVVRELMPEILNKEEKKKKRK